MAEFELGTETNALLEDGDGRDAEIYARNVQRLKKAKVAKRQRFVFIAVSVIGLIIVVLLLLYTPSLRRHPPPDPVEDFPVTQLEPEFFEDYGSQRVQIKYGPFTVPGSDFNNGMKNFRLKDGKVPCHGCLITWMQADLQFADGSSANAATGMWLHHTVFVNRGRPAVKSCRSGHERFFASGNERTVVDLTLNGTVKSGYWLGETDKVSMSTELMNESADPRDAFLTITYEHIPNLPSDFSKATSIWLDVGECNGSEVPVPDDTTSFELDMSPWTATLNGRLLTTLSHLHDGGVHLDVAKNDEVVCRSVATYGDASEHKRHMPGMDMSHISYMSTCYDAGRIQEGEQWTVKAKYDLNAHEPMLDGDGEPDDVMGIAVMYVVED